MGQLGLSKPGLADLDWAQSCICDQLVGQLEAPDTHTGGWLAVGCDGVTGPCVSHHPESHIMLIYSAFQQSSKRKSRNAPDVLRSWLVTSTAFHWSKPVTKPAQVWGKEEEKPLPLIWGAESHTAKRVNVEEYEELEAFKSSVNLILTSFPASIHSSPPSLSPSIKYTLTGHLLQDRTMQVLEAWLENVSSKL